MKYLGIASGIVAVSAATMLLASLPWIAARLQSSAAPPSSAVMVTFPEMSEWDGALLEMLEYKAAHCADEIWIDSPGAKARCDLRVLEGTLKLLPASKGNGLFMDLTNDFGAALLDIRTSGNRNLADQRVISGALVELALDRAAILRGAAPLERESSNWPPSQMFSWMPKPESRDFWKARWLTVRVEDCRAYPVKQCAAKLDLAFSRVMNALPDELVDDRKKDAAWQLDEKTLFLNNFGGKRAEICLRTSAGDYREAYRNCLDRYVDENLDVGQYLEAAEERPPAPAGKLI
jgi:hypothetical protein